GARPSVRGLRRPWRPSSARLFCHAPPATHCLPAGNPRDLARPRMQRQSVVGLAGFDGRPCHPAAVLERIVSTTMPAPADTPGTPPIAFLVVSGGAVTVSLDLVQWAWRHGLRCAVFALREPSLVRALPGVCAFASVPHGIARADAITALRQFVASLPRLGDRTMPAYPTE